MIKVKCVEKVRNKLGVIKSYVIEDTSGSRKKVDAQEFKKLIKNGTLECSNLKLTKDNRLIEKHEDNIDNAKEELTDSIRSIINYIERGTNFKVNPNSVNNIIDNKVVRLEFNYEESRLIADLATNASEATISVEIPKFKFRMKNIQFMITDRFERRVFLPRAFQLINIINRMLSVQAGDELGALYVHFMQAAWKIATNEPDSTAISLNEIAKMYNINLAKAKSIVIQELEKYKDEAVLPKIVSDILVDMSRENNGNKPKRSEYSDISIDRLCGMFLYILVIAEPMLIEAEEELMDGAEGIVIAKAVKAAVNKNTKLTNEIKVYSKMGISNELINKLSIEIKDWLAS